MSWRNEPPFRADHVGSLLRPPALLRARADHAAGSIDAAELRAVEDEAIGEAVRMQEATGLQLATDGELRRGSWHMDFIYQLGGARKLDADLEVSSTTRAATSSSRRRRCASTRPCASSTRSSATTSRSCATP